MGKAIQRKSWSSWKSWGRQRPSPLAKGSMVCGETRLGVYWRPTSAIMNIASDKPPVLIEERFKDADLTLIEYNDVPGDRPIFQLWHSTAFNIHLWYSDDLITIKGTNTIRPQSLPEQSYYTRFSTFIPPIVKEKEQAGQPFKLATLSENFEDNRILQVWDLDGKFIEVYLNHALEIQEYTIRDTQGEIWTILDYQGDGTPKLLTHRDEQMIFHRKYYHPNGQLNTELSETNQGIRVGTSYYFNEDGSPIAQHDFEHFPYHNIGYNKAKEIARQAGITAPKMDFMLHWKISDENFIPRIQIDAATGQYSMLQNEPVATPPPKKHPRFDRFLADLVGRENVYLDDAEIISSPQDYISILEALRKIAHTGFDVGHIAMSGKGEVWTAELTINQIQTEFNIQGDTDWFDDAFIKNINLLLRESGSKHTFYSVHDSTWGQEMCFIYIHDTLAQCIAAFIQQHQWSDQPWASIDNLVDFSS